MYSYPEKGCPVFALNDVGHPFSGKLTWVMGSIKMQSDLSASGAIAGRVAVTPPRLDLRRRFRIGERVVQIALFLCGAISVLTTGARGAAFFSTAGSGSV